MPLKLLLVLAFVFTSFTTSAASHFPTNSIWKYFKGVTEASIPDRTAWRTYSFNDSAWPEGQAPFYFDSGPLSGRYTGNTELTDMQGSYNHVFLRRRFTIDDPALIYALKIRFQVDDGFVMWVNGRELYRQNVNPTSTLTNGSTTSVSAEPPQWRVVDLAAIRPASYLQSGENVIAIQLINATRADNDLLFDFALDTTTAEGTRPTITAVNPVRGSRVTQLTSVEVTFSEAVVGIDAGDLIVNGLPCDTMTQAGNTYTFRFTQPVYGQVNVSWDPDHNIIDASLLPNGFDAKAPGSTWVYDFADVLPPVVRRLYPAAGSSVRSFTQLEVSFSEVVAGVEAADLLVNGQPATNLMVFPGGNLLFQFPQPAAGAVALQWRNGHGITDLATPALAFGGGSWVLTLDPSALVPDLLISEILAANKSGLVDEDGDQEAWIELWNRGTTPVNLEGWSLSDDPNEPGKWVFPSSLLGAGGRLVVFASGKDRPAPSQGNRFHTNFKLALGGEFLGLFSPESPRQFISGFASGYPEQRNDISYGWVSAGSFGFFNTPTPGAANGTSTVAGVVEPVEFNVQRGLFRSPIDLTLDTPTPGALIRYTTDGSEPTVSSGRVYFQPLRITNNTTVRAVAFRKNLLPSRTVTHSYLFNLPTTQRSLPIISIVTASNNLVGRTGIIGMGGGSRGGSGEFIANSPSDYHNPSMHGIAWERPVSAELIHADGAKGFQIDCGLRVQGSDYQRPRTTAESKFSFRMYFRSDYGEGKLRYPLMPQSPVQEFDQVVLRAGFNDPDNPFIRDELGRQLSDDMGMVASHGTLVSLFINGVYKGYYNPAERVEETTLQGFHGGGPEWDVIGQFGQIVDGDRANLQSLLDMASRTNTATAAGFQAVAARLDVENFIDYLLVNIYSSMGDWPANNWRAGRDRSPGGLWRFYVWDAEWGFGLYGRSSSTDTFAESGGGPNDSGLGTSCEITTLYQRLVLNPEFKLMFADRVHKHLFHSGALTEGNITRRFNELRDIMAGALPGMDGSIPGWARERRPVVLGLFQKYGLYASSNAPGPTRLPGRVTLGTSFQLTNRAGDIYFTLDGSDPRERLTGQISSNAVRYSSSIVLDRSVRLRARAFQDFAWSALYEGDYVVDGLGSPLRITEIMADPAGGGAYEYLEVLNISGAPVDASGVWLAGVSFVFPDNTILAPGARVIIASGISPSLFAQRYPGVAPVGYFSGGLNNGGERLTLYERDGRIIQTVDYLARPGWPVANSQNGLSLEIIDPAGDPDSSANWRTSSNQNGTPGAPNGAGPAPSIRFSELMASNTGSVTNGLLTPDWVEIQNVSNQAMDLAGWSLSRGEDFRQFVFPPSTVVQPGAYLVVWCDSAFTAPGLHSGFSLDAQGDAIRLHDSSGLRVDAIGFGPQARDLSIGRVDGAWRLCEPTPGETNRTATVGSLSSISINEWLANPVSGQPDWIELYNRELALPVDLSGAYLSISNHFHRLPPLSFLEPAGFLKLIADETPGGVHLDFKLPASGGFIALHEPSGIELSRVTYPRQAEGVTRGRFPDGANAFRDFPGIATPGESNQVFVVSSILIHEFMARPQPGASDWIEIHNGSDSTIQLTGYGLSTDESSAEWLFPAGVAIGPRGYLTVLCDPVLPASTSNVGQLNTGRALPAEGSTIWLFDAGGRALQAVPYGQQISGQSVGVIGGQWLLLSTPTPGAANASAAPVAPPTAARLNEWMANPARGEDWVELFNTTNIPVALAGAFLTDDPSLAGTNLHQIVQLSFVPASGWTVFQADSSPSRGPDHLEFSLASQGGSIRYYTTNLVLIDSVDYGSQESGVSSGRLPDGTSAMRSFPNGGSPGSMNHVRPAGVVINEIIVPPAPTDLQGIELLNLGEGPVDLSGWMVTDNPALPGKYLFSPGTVIQPGGFLGISYGALAGGGLGGVMLDPTYGGEVWLIKPAAAGVVSGEAYRAVYPPSVSAGSYVRWLDSAGERFLASSAASPQAVNSAPRTGPLIINELMVNPPTEMAEGGRDEFIEILNTSDSPVSLSVSGETVGRWRLRGGVSMDFSGDVSLSGGAYLLLVSFDPVADAAATSAFRLKYGLSGQVRLLGPYSGRLGNEGDEVRLERRVADLTGWRSAENVDSVQYDANPPWPDVTPNMTARSLHRIAPSMISNDVFSWQPGVPSPGAASSPRLVDLPVFQIQPSDQTGVAGTPFVFGAQATGPGPIAYQWRRNGQVLRGKTNSTLSIPYLDTADSGLYDVMASNPGGTAVSLAARLEVVSAPVLVVGPEDRTLRRGSNFVFQAHAIGSGLITYRWAFNGQTIPGATQSSLSLSNAQLSHEGAYSVIASNAFGVDVVTANLQVLASPLFYILPQPLVALEGQAVRMTGAAEGNNPITYRWRRNNAAVTGQTTSNLSISAVTLAQAGTYTLVASNIAGTTTSSGATLIVYADADRDGLPDFWETAHGLNPGVAGDQLLDSDGDGLTNKQEYLAGSDPRNPTSKPQLSLSMLADGRLSIGFLAPSNRIALLEQREDLTQGGWVPLQGFPIRSTNRQETFVAPMPPGDLERFFRLNLSGAQ